MSSLDKFAADSERHHAEQVAAGKHDPECEWGPRVYAARRFQSASTTYNHLCHCSKRRREAAGHDVLPGEIEWQNPRCPTCYEELEGDGDSWTCDSCHVSWGSNGDDAEWTDEYGDLGTAAP